MRNLMTAAVVAAAVVVGLSGQARAEGGAEYAGAVARKLGHGLASMAYAPVDVLTTACAFGAEFEGKNGAVAAPTGFLLGAVSGVFNAFYRYNVGGAEVFTFAFVGNPSEARPFDFTPATGWSILNPPQAVTEPVRTASNRRRPSGD